MSAKRTDEFLRQILDDNRLAREIATERGVSVRLVHSWRMAAYKRFGIERGPGVRPGWGRCPTCGQTTRPGDA